MSYQYDAASNRTRLTWPDSCYATYSYDALNHPSTVVDSAGTTLATYGYDDLARRTSLQYSGSAGATLSYAWSPENDLTGLTNDLAGTTNDVSFTNTFSPAHQWTSATLNNGAYAYTPPSNNTVTYGSNALNQYATLNGTTQLYDTRGNFTGATSTPNLFYYDAENRMVLLGTPFNGTYAFDPLGRRTSKTISSVTTNFIHDGDSEIAEAVVDADQAALGRNRPDSSGRWTQFQRRRDMADITFHSMADSAYLWTAMHVADEKGVAYEFAPLVYNSPEHLKLHPFGKMPIFQHGGHFLYETAAIAHYIDKAFEGPPLQPAGALAQAHVIRWIGIVNSYVFPVMNRFMKERLVKRAWGFDVDQVFIAAAQGPLALQVQLIDEALTKSNYLVGDALTIADSFLLPHLLFFGLTPEGKALLAKSPGASAWLARLRARPSFAVNPMRQAYEAMSSIKVAA